MCNSCTRLKSNSWLNSEKSIHPSSPSNVSRRTNWTTLMLIYYSCRICLESVWTAIWEVEPGPAPIVSDSKEIVPYQAVLWKRRLSPLPASHRCVTLHTPHHFHPSHSLSLFTVPHLLIRPFCAYPLRLSTLPLVVSYSIRLCMLSVSCLFSYIYCRPSCYQA